MEFGWLPQNVSCEGVCERLARQQSASGGHSARHLPSINQCPAPDTTWPAHLMLHCYIKKLKKIINPHYQSVL